MDNLPPSRRDKTKSPPRKELILPKGTSRPEEKMIKEILGLGKTNLSRIMVPKADVVSCPADRRVAELLPQFNQCGHSRLPVYADTADNVVGVVHLKDLFRILSIRERGEIADMPAVEFVRLPHFIYEKTSGLDALLQLQRNKISLAVVIDEFGAVVGLVTLEDLLEEIVGEMTDEFDLQRRQMIAMSGEGRYVLDPKLELGQFADSLGIELPVTTAATVAGLIYHLADRIPKVGEKIRFNEWEFTILEGTSRKITKVAVEKVTN